jgi:hypothetical protein
LRHGIGNPVAGDFAMARLQLLAQDLKRIEAADAELLKHYRNRMRKAAQDGSYYGIRFEVKMAAMLIKWKLKFTRPEPPDFSVDLEGQTAFIECGSARLRESNEGDIWYKVAQEVRDKASKPYANLSTVLAVDVTNLRFHGLGVETPTAMLDLKPRLVEQLRSLSLGSVLLYNYLWDRKDGKYHAAYVRVDNENCGPALLRLLEILAPYRRLQVDLPGFAIEG